MTSRPVVIGRENVPTRGPCIIASTHQSPYDVPLLMRHTPRLLDFISIVEVFRNPFVAWFYGSMNAVPLDRSRPDTRTVRIILARLGHGRAVAMFPEGGLREGRESVIHTQRIKGGIGRMARLAGAPVVPTVVIGSQSYRKVLNWFPWRRVTYGVSYGEAIPPDTEPEMLEQQLITAFVTLHRELRDHMGAPDPLSSPAGGSPVVEPTDGSAGS